MIYNTKTLSYSKTVAYHSNNVTPP